MASAKKDRRILCKGAGLKYEFIHSQRKEYKVVRLYAVIEVSTSGFRDGLIWSESNRSRDNRQLPEKISGV